MNTTSSTSSSGIDIKKFPLLSPEFKHELDEIPSTLTDELPFGIRFPDRTLKRFKVVEQPVAAALSHIHNKNFVINNPGRWFAMAMAYLLESIEDIPVFSEFQTSNFKVIPDICLQITNFDALYVLIYAHNEYYGSEVIYNDYVCPACKHRDTHTLYVDKFYVDRKDIQIPIEVHLNKPIGRFRIQESGREDIPPDMMFDKVYLTVPTLRTAIKHKDLYKPNSDSQEEYNLAVRMDHVVLGNSDGYILDERMMFFVRNEIWKKLSEKDKLKIHRAFEDVPRIYPVMRADCANCGSRVLVSLNFFSLLPETI